ncbi:ATP-binding protein [Streptomyces sp. NPDC050560]|uniref:ATP-binding protein n=1 Tax=Streptomyces sp. NPDC050560 TaxID=3365630 RepID=UPI003792DCA5
MQMLQVQLDVLPDPTEVGRARRWTRGRLSRAGVNQEEAVAETLLLIVSELVTNAVVHTRRPSVLRLLVSGEMVRVEVVDDSARPPRPRHAEGDETGGRGLELVDGLADRWGWEPDHDGKRVWCELNRTRTSPPSLQQPLTVPVFR